MRDITEIKINELAPYETDWNNLIETKEKEGKVDREISTLINKLSASETEEVRIQTQIADQIKLIDEYHQNEEQIKKNGEIREEIKGKRDLLEEVKKNFTKTNKKLLDLNGKVSSLKNQKETLEDKITEVKKLEEQSKLYEYYLNSLSKDGVSYELIEKALPMIEGEVNNILAQIVEFGMQLEMDGKNINAYLVYGDNKWSLEMCSGMERFISGLAIRVALINVCNLPRPNFLVIDEGFGTLDSENLQSLFMLFTYLKTQFDFVMIISHIDSMRDVVDGLIEIKKVEGFSHVKF
jgi:exonuclease SbcC